MSHPRETHPRPPHHCHTKFWVILGAGVCGEIVGDHVFAWSHPKSAKFFQLSHENKGAKTAYFGRCHDLDHTPTDTPIVMSSHCLICNCHTRPYCRLWKCKRCLLLICRGEFGFWLSWGFSLSTGKLEVNLTWMNEWMKSWIFLTRPFPWVGITLRFGFVNLDQFDRWISSIK
jgi:hypothetical protein